MQSIAMVQSAARLLKNTHRWVDKSEAKIPVAPKTTDIPASGTTNTLEIMPDMDIFPKSEATTGVPAIHVANEIPSAFKIQFATVKRLATGDLNCAAHFIQSRSPSITVNDNEHPASKMEAGENVYIATAAIDHAVSESVFLPNIPADSQKAAIIAARIALGFAPESIT